MSFHTLLDLSEAEVSQGFNQALCDVALERIGQLVVIASAEHGNDSELGEVGHLGQPRDFSRRRSCLLKELDGLWNESVNTDVGVETFVLLSIACRRTHLNDRTVHVHVVVVNVLLPRCHSRDKLTVLTNEVLASSHRSSNKRSVVVELVDVVELREDFWRHVRAATPSLEGSVC